MWPGPLLHNSLIRSVKGLPSKSFLRAVFLIRALGLAGGLFVVPG